MEKQRWRYCKRMLMIAIFLFALLMPGIVLGADNLTTFDSLFSSGKVTVYQSKGEFTNDSSLTNSLITYFSYYNFSEGYHVNVSSCSLEKMTCNFELKTISGTTVRNYSSVKINLITDIKNNFPGMINEESKILIDYDGSLLNNETERNEYAIEYIASLSTNGYSNWKEYVLDFSQLSLIRKDYEDNEIVRVYEIGYTGFIFEHKETEFSADFKKLTSSEILSIKTNTTLNVDFLNNYLSNFSYYNDNYSIRFLVDGNINDKYVFIKMFVDNGDEVTIEKHKIELVKTGINKDIFKNYNLGDALNINVEQPNTEDKVSSFVNSFARYYTNFYSDENTEFIIDTIFNEPYSVYVTYRHYNKDELDDIQVNKIPVVFNNYSAITSSEFTKKVGDKLVVNSNNPSYYEVENSLTNTISDKFVLFRCNEGYSVCEVGLKDELNNTYEIHKINVEFNVDPTEQIKKDLNVYQKADEFYVDIITDKNMDIDYLYFTTHNNSKGDTYIYYCSVDACEITVVNQATRRYENYSVGMKKLELDKSDYYNSKVLENQTIYIGKTLSNENTENLLINTNIFNRNNEDDVELHSCSITKNTCRVIVYNTNNMVEIHDVKVNFKKDYSDDFKTVYTNNKLELNAVKKNNYQYLELVSRASILSKNRVNGFLLNDNSGIYGVLNGFELGKVEVNYQESNSEIATEMVAIKRDIENSSGVVLEDMDYVNWFYNLHYDAEMLDSYNSYSLYKELSLIINDKHVSYTFVPNGMIGNSYGGYVDKSYGKLLLYYNGVAYDMIDSVKNINYNHVIYIANDTPDTIDDYVKAAQARIDGHLGKNSGVIISYYDEIDNGLYGYLEDSLGISSSMVDGHEYIMTYNGRAEKMLIIKDSSKMVGNSFAAVDVNTNIRVTSNNITYPGNIVVSSEILSKTNERYIGLLKKYTLENAEVVDINLYSPSRGMINEFGEATYKVSVPLLNSKLNKNNLVAYYIDNNGKVEKHPVTMDGLMATFETNHFSTYIIATKDDEKLISKLATEVVNNPNTTDYIVTVSLLLIVSGLAYWYFKIKLPKKTIR